MQKLPRYQSSTHLFGVRNFLPILFKVLFQVWWVLHSLLFVCFFSKQCVKQVLLINQQPTTTTAWSNLIDWIRPDYMCNVLLNQYNVSITLMHSQTFDIVFGKSDIHYLSLPSFQFDKDPFVVFQEVSVSPLCQPHFFHFQEHKPNFSAQALRI